MAILSLSQDGKKPVKNAESVQSVDACSNGTCEHAGHHLTISEKFDPNSKRYKHQQHVEKIPEIKVDKQIGKHMNVRNLGDEPGDVKIPTINEKKSLTPADEARGRAYNTAVNKVTIK
jgi:hypothetical protein